MIKALQEDDLALLRALMSPWRTQHIIQEDIFKIYSYHKTVLKHAANVHTTFPDKSEPQKARTHFQFVVFEDS